MAKVEVLQGRKDSLLEGCHWSKWTSPGKRKNFDLSLTAYSKINSKWVTDLNIKHKTFRREKKTDKKNFRI